MDPTPPKKLLDQVRDSLRVKHYAYRTEESYVQWIRRYILFHNKRHPKDMAESEVQAFLTHLAVEGNVAASTQNQALSALLFLYRHGSYVFPAKQRSIDSRSNEVRRHHQDDGGLQRSLKQAVRSAQIDKNVSCHTLRHSFAFFCNARLL
jgi:site-specific recombinase XerD